MAAIPHYVFENLARKIYMSLCAKRKEKIEKFMKNEGAKKAAAMLAKKPVQQIEAFLSLGLVESVCVLREKIGLPSSKYISAISISSVEDLRKNLHSHVESEYMQSLPTFASQSEIQEDIVTRYYMDKNIKDAFDDIEEEYLSKLS